MLSTFIVFLLICASNININVLAECVKDLPKNCNCSNSGFLTSTYSCKDEKNSEINLTVSLWGTPGIEISCEKETVSKEWYNSLKDIKEGTADADITFRVISCPIPDEPIKEFLVKKVGLSIRGEITTLYITSMNDVKNFDPSFSANLFANLTQLKEVHFENTNLEHLPSNFFQPVRRKIMTIDLTKNNLSRVSVDIFNNLTILRRLDLSENNLTQLEEGTFSKLYKLQVLSLSENHLNQLSADIFKDLKDLEFLYLDSNNLATLTRKMFTPLRRLMRLNLLYNGITTLDADIFEDLRRMRILNLGYNNISSAIIPKLISNMPNLEEIVLNGNGITQLAEDTFSKSPKLQKVFLKNNLLNELPDTLFQESVKLEEIDLSYNKLITLKETQFQKLEELKELFLENNELTSIPANTFKGLKNLFLLHLNNNHLTSLPDAFFQDVGELVKDNGVVVRWPKLEISLHNNPWKCDCDGKYLLSFLKNSPKVEVPHVDMITCAKNGLAVNSTSLQEICPTSSG